MRKQTTYAIWWTKQKLHTKRTQAIKKSITTIEIQLQLAVVGFIVVRNHFFRYSALYTDKRKIFLIDCDNDTNKQNHSPWLFKDENFHEIQFEWQSCKSYTVSTISKMCAHCNYNITIILYRVEQKKKHSLRNKIATHSKNDAVKKLNQFM